MECRICSRSDATLSASPRAGRYVLWEENTSSILMGTDTFRLSSLQFSSTLDTPDTYFITGCIHSIQHLTLQALLPAVKV
jgi:hypothetical protein